MLFRREDAADMFFKPVCTHIYSIYAHIQAVEQFGLANVTHIFKVRLCMQLLGRSTPLLRILKDTVYALWVSCYIC